MAATFLLEIATPERLLLREHVAEAQIPALNGYIGVLPEHSPLLSELGTGDLSYNVNGRRYSMLVSGGYVEVLPEHTRVLAVVAERADEIDAARAQEAYKRAQERLQQSPQGVDVARALNALKRAQARLEVSKHR